MRIALPGSLPGQLLQVLDGSQAARGQFFGVFVAQFVKRKRTLIAPFRAVLATALRYPREACDAFRPVRVNAAEHWEAINRPLRQPLCRDEWQSERHAKAFAGNVIVDIASGHQRNATTSRAFDQPIQVSLIVGAAVKFGQQITVSAKDIAKTSKLLGDQRGIGRARLPPS